MLGDKSASGGRAEEERKREPKWKRKTDRRRRERQTPELDTFGAPIKKTNVFSTGSNVQFGMIIIIHAFAIDAAYCIRIF